ncbi:flavin monoamine oxidase family protein [Actinomadura macra]|uniref:flavin monoamine oxidase family protein n=1 Tax=Actinomadura macra TaxID=46164 RepID=UPI000833AED9|nr:FAD-dependent oxidoreductase [Actinomadura macra]
MRGVTRRSFLEAVGTTGGSGALFGVMGALGLAPTAAANPAPFEPPSPGDLARLGGPTPRVVVLGGGVTGLATAHELRKAGYECLVLEAKDRPGGRNWTVRGGTAEKEITGYRQRARFAEGEYMNAGPARIAQFMVTLDYCRELGIPIEPFTIDNCDACVYYEDAGPLSRRRIENRKVKADVFGHVSELLAKATDQGALDKELDRDDRERLLAFLEDFGALTREGDRLAYTGTNRRGYRVLPNTGDPPGVIDGPPPSVHDVLASGIGRDLAFEIEWPFQMVMFQPVGGMDRIPYALARRIGADRIRYGAQVLEVTDLPSGVEVLYTDGGGRERREHADYCVATLPPYIMARIPTNLGADVTAALERPSRVPVSKIGLEYRRRWWEEDERIYGGLTHTDMDIGQIWYPCHGYHGRRGVLIGAYTEGPSTEGLDAMAPADRIRRAVAQGVKIHGPAYARELVSGFAVNWDRVPHIETGWVRWPSWTDGAYDLLNRPHGRVYFAGEWLTGFIGWQAGAIESARRAVTQIHWRTLVAGGP